MKTDTTKLVRYTNASNIPTIDNIIQGLYMYDYNEDISGNVKIAVRSTGRSTDGLSEQLAHHTEVLLREEQVALTGMEQWYARLEWVENKIRRGKVTIEDTWGMEPLQSNWSAVVNFLTLYHAIDEELRLADSVLRSKNKKKQMTMTMRQRIANKLKEYHKERSKKERQELFIKIGVTEVEKEEIIAWQKKNTTKKGYRSTKLILDNGTTLASRSANIRHAVTRQAKREDIKKKHPGYSMARVEDIVDPRKKGYYGLDTQILRQTGRLDKSGFLIREVE
jgi:hypothetical protein